MATSNWRCHAFLLHSSSGRMPENIESKSHFSITPMLCAPWSPGSQSRFLLIKWMSPLIKFHLGLGAGTKLCLPSENEGTVKDRWEKLSPRTLPGCLWGSVSRLIKGERERERERGKHWMKKFWMENQGKKTSRDGEAYSRASVWASHWEFCRCCV